MEGLTTSCDYAAWAESGEWRVETGELEWRESCHQARSERPNRSLPLDVSVAHHSPKTLTRRSYTDLDN